FLCRLPLGSFVHDGEQVAPARLDVVMRVFYEAAVYVGNLDDLDLLYDGVEVCGNSLGMPAPRLVLISEDHDGHRALEIPRKPGRPLASTTGVARGVQPSVN